MRTLIFAAVLVIGASGLSRAQEPAAGGDLERMRKSLSQLTTENEALRTRVAELERRLKITRYATV